MSRRNDGGTVSVIALASIGLTLLLSAIVTDLGVFIAYRLQVAAAADAAAPVTFRPYGAAGGPAAEAARFAAEN